MRDDQHRAAIADEVLLEPGDGVEIEVVGRLVEQQEVGLLGEHDAEMEPPALAAREARDRARHVGSARSRACCAMISTLRSSSSPCATW